MPKLLFAAGLLLASLTLAMCQKETTGTTYDCTGLTPTYTNDIKAIINTNCAKSGCHDASTQEAGIDLSTYAKVKSESSNARFLGAIEHRTGYEAMPQDASKLADANIQKIYCWIENGQPE